MNILIRIGLLLALAWPAWSADQDALQQVQERLRAQLPESAHLQVRESAAPGLYEVQDGMAFGYVTADGRYLVQGELIDLQDGVSLTEQGRAEFRAGRIRALAGGAIEFAPVDREVLHEVQIFVDVECQYCSDLHREVPQMNLHGISVQYLFYPRRGEHSRGFELARKAWCADDRKKALTRLFEGHSVESEARCADPIAEQLAAALELEVRGTPMIVLPGGGVHYGYLGADQLLALLEPTADSPATPSAPARRSGPPR